jgi:Zn-dependent peptidase ImmA (M78 family)
MDVGWRDPKELEIEAEIVLADYSNKVKPIKDPPVPIENIIEALFGLQLEIDQLNGGNLNRDIFGCLYMDEGKIIVDTELQNQEGRYNFTCAHEAGHWALHRNLYLRNSNQIPLFPEEKQPSIICRKSQKRRNIEWQADYFAGALLMPKEMVKSVLKQREKNDFAETFTDETLKFWGMPKKEYCRMVASLYNKQFGVSVQAMQIRLEQLGYLKQEVSGVLL